MTGKNPQMIEKRKHSMPPTITKKTRSKASKKLDKPFLVEFRYTKVSHPLLSILMEWHGKRKYETLEDAKTYAKKLGRENIASRREVRITDLREGTEHAVD